MTPFAEIQARALSRHSAGALAARIPAVKSADELRATPDDRYLAAIAKRVFAAGFRWRVIEVKWPGFEAAFDGFDPATVAGYDDERIGALAADPRIVRNRPKVVSTVANARFVQGVAREHGSFGAWLGSWPQDDVPGLWAALKARGDRLGGDTGPWVLRLVGRDTFRLSRDVVDALIEAGVVARPPSTKAELAAVQAAFSAWRAESGLSNAAISVTLGCSTGPVYERAGDEE